VNDTHPKVLVVDDEESIRLLLSRGLKHAGFELREAKDGQDAIEQLDAGAFDALVLDLMMPRVDGFGVVEHLKATNPAMIEKTVVVTAFPKASAQERLHHACSVISKPFDRRELIDTVRGCAGK
jgi:two-component system chemotaxis response regulator CheY